MRIRGDEDEEKNLHETEMGTLWMAWWEQENTHFIQSRPSLKLRRKRVTNNITLKSRFIIEVD